MKRKAFILTELMMSMMLQSGFVIVLGGAFYMLLSFGTSTQQMLAAQDEGEIVISYVDARIRNAGLGLQNCKDSTGNISPAGIARAFDVTSNFGNTLNNLDLPVAITSTPTSNPDNATVSNTNGVYEGNVLTLLYARKDTKSDNLFVMTNNDVYNDSEDITAGNYKKFRLVAKPNANKNKIEDNTNFVFSKSYININSWAVLEATGVPVLLSNYKEENNTKYTFSIYAPYIGARIYPMSELLNLECERIYAGYSVNERSLMLNILGTNTSKTKAEWNTATPHTRGILEIYLTLDTKPSVPILDLKVLVSEGRNKSGDTQRPREWPEKYWYTDNNNNHEDFRQHRVHVSQASWKLYNLAPFFRHNSGSGITL